MINSQSFRPSLLLGVLVISFLLAPCQFPAEAQDINRLTGIYGMDAGGANFRLVVKLDGKWNGTPSYSPDGKQLLFDASPAGEFEQGHVYSMPSDGEADSVVDLGLGSTPAWSPDGKRIAFYIHSDNPDQAEPGVWAMNADGSERIWLCYGSAPRWLPDGKRLFLVNNPGGEGTGIYLFNLENNETESVLEPGRQRILGAACSPDGKRLAYIGDSGAGPELVILPLTGDQPKGQVRLRGPIGWRPSWTPDGKFVTCWIANPDGRKQLHRVEADSKREPEMLAHQDEGQINSDASWSADGKRVVFISNR